ncbi:MAG: crossover junction endodeoxyribonuclease RuvC [Pseudomonadota bacterium]
MTSPIKILGIDPGLRRTGWGLIAVDGVRLSYIASGLVTSDAAEPLGVRLRQLFEGITEVVRGHRPAEAAVEETFVNRDARSALKLGQARGMAMLVPSLAGIPTAEYAPNLIKKTVTGAGHAEKHQISAMLKVLLPKARPESEDEADALAVAICHAHHRGRRTALLGTAA